MEVKAFRAVGVCLVRATSVALLLTLFPSLSRANTFVAFGPQQYVRDNGAPSPRTTTFTVLDPTTTFTLRVDSKGVSSAIITLNGAEIFRPSDFNANVHLLTKPVTLLATNQLTVELRGKPGESLTLQFIGVDNVPPTITGTVTPAPNAAGWNNSNPTIIFNCADKTSGIASCTPPVTITTETAGQNVVGTALDKAGNAATASVLVKLDKTAPSLTLNSIVNGSYVSASPISISGTVADALSGLAGVNCNGASAVINGNNFNCTVTLTPGANSINAVATDIAGNSSTATLSLIYDNTPPKITAAVTPAPNSAGWNHSNAIVTFTCSDDLSGVASCTPPVSVTTETAGQVVVGTATDKAGNTATTSATVRLDKTPPNIIFTSPSDGAKVFTSPISISGTVTDALSGLAGVNCNRTPAVVNGTNFNCGVTLTSGTNSVAVTATDAAGNTSTSNLSLSYTRVPTVTITSPANLSYLNISPTTVTGTVDDPTATVTVNSVQAAVVNGGFSVALPLAEGPNVITASATAGAGQVVTSSVSVTLDTTPPHVTILSPPDQFVTAGDSITVAGSVNDIVVGTVNAEQAQVSVNGVAAQVSNRTFLAVNVPLTIGPNVIQAVGRDRVGNAATTQITVTRQASTQAQIRLISGNNQTGTVGSILTAPLVIALADGAGNPVPNKPVIFKVMQNDGMVSTGGQPAPTVIATTDAQGRAQAQWKLGMRAGAGGNSVEAYSVGFDGTAIFTATGTQGPAGKIVVDTGNDQIGAINQPLPKPLIAVVVDAGNNRLAGVPVTFTVKGGGGSFGGQPIFTVNTDSDGRAAATLTLGLQEGNTNNLVEANFPSNTGFPVSFTASGRAPGDPAKTTISGVVLDNSNVPIPGVTVRAVLTNLLNSNSTIIQSVAAVQTNEQGQFTIPQAPVGFVKLLVDGSTAQRPGTYPTLDYDMVTVAGQANTLAGPIFLLSLNEANKLCVTATTGGGTLTIPEAPGFSLTFGPGQVTFPGGSKEGCVSVTVVHGDKVPMTPGFGQQPRFIVTIQPAGAVFNPPAAITLPNVDGLRPREVTEMYSFDHDIGSFVAIGTGTVSDDGRVIRSNPGIGVLKAGWHCGGNPNVQGTAAHCAECYSCQQNQCQPDNNLLPVSVGRCAKCSNGFVTLVTGSDPTVAGECCLNGQVVNQPVTTYASLLSQCPGRTQNNVPHVIDGCSVDMSRLGALFVPLLSSVLPPFQTITDGQDPMKAKYGDLLLAQASTAFGMPQSIPGQTASSLPCNQHDICYQTCGIEKDRCDQSLRQDIQAVCLRAYPTTCPFNSLDKCAEYQGQRAVCLEFADAYYTGVHNNLFQLAAGFPFEADQLNYCKCCR
jgi:Glucodextranase, domain B